jgi:amino acid transporter
MNAKKIIIYAYYLIAAVLVAIALIQIYTGNEMGGSTFIVQMGRIALGIAILAALGLSVMGLINNPKSLIWVLAGVAVLAILYFIGKSGAPDALTIEMKDDGLSLQELQNSHAGVWVSLAMLGITIVMAVASGVKSMLD